MSGRQMHPDAVRDAVEALRSGRPVLLLDDASWEDEGDLVRPGDPGRTWEGSQAC